MAVCGNESMRPLGVTYFRGSGEIVAGSDPVWDSGTRGHFCQLPAGHEGSHQCKYVERVGYDIGLGYAYAWDDEHQLVCQPFFVKLEPDPMRIVPFSGTGSTEDVTINIKTTEAR